jgi:CRISPR/Cas system Type II protein with McrA/HNH and RuvC-like nuclease domain
MKKQLGNQILILHNEGMSYREISKQLNCSRGTVSYYCGEGQKTKTANRTRQRRKNSPLETKLEDFLKPTKPSKQQKSQNEKTNRILYFKLYTFHGNQMSKITVEELKTKIGPNPTCYLTGQPIDLTDSKSYNLDHIQPRSKGGDNSLENLGLATRQANMCKSDLNLEEFLQLCKSVLSHHNK